MTKVTRTVSRAPDANSPDLAGSGASVKLRSISKTALAKTTPRLVDSAETASSPQNSGIPQEVRFGRISVYAPTPTPAQVAVNVELSTQILGATLDAIQKPGVRIARRKNVPLYYADVQHPGKIVRELNGLREIGIVDGTEFVVTG